MTCLKDLNVGDLTDAGTQGMLRSPLSLARACLHTAADMAGRKPSCRVQTHACSSRSIQLRNRKLSVCTRKICTPVGGFLVAGCEEEGLPGRHQMLGGTGIAGLC